MTVYKLLPRSGSRNSTCILLATKGPHDHGCAGNWDMCSAARLRAPAEGRLGWKRCLSPLWSGFLTGATDKRKARTMFSAAG